MTPRQKLIFFTNKKPTTSEIAWIQIGDTAVQGKDHVKLLGTILNIMLTLKAHVQARTKTALYNINLKKKCLESIHNRHYKMLMSTLFLAQIDYVNSILASSAYSIIKSYQKVQNFSARKTFKIPQRDSIHQGL